MTSVVDIYNLALANLDLAQRVESTNDTSAAAGACNQYYDFCRRYVLENAYWSFATKAVALALLFDQSTVTSASQIVVPGWRYIYARPNDCLRAHAVTTMWGMRANPWMNYWWQIPNVAYGSPSWGPFRPPWRQVVDTINVPPGQSIDIVTDQDGAWLVYTTDVTNPTVWSTALQDCVAWYLSAKIAGPLSANENAKKLALQMGPKSLSDALAVNLNEEQPDAYPDSPSIQARM